MESSVRNFSQIIIFLSFFACQDIQRPPLFSLLLLLPGGSEKAGIVSTDFGSAGKFSLLDGDSLLVKTAPVNIHSDASVRFQDGRIYIINRLNRDSILVLNPFMALVPELEFSVERGSNPQDFLKLSPDKAYVSRYNSTVLLVVNPSTGATSGTIELRKYSETTSNGSAGPDGKPEMSRMFLDGNSVFLAVQRLDRNDPSGYFSPNSYSVLLEIDSRTDTVIGEYRMTGTNPVSRIIKADVFGEPHLLVATPGKMGFISQIDGGISAFRLSTRTFLDNFVYSEKEAGGDLLDFQIGDTGEGYAFVTDAGFNKELQIFNLSTGKKLGRLGAYPASTGNFSGLYYSKIGKLYAGESGGGNPGITIYNTKNGNLKLTSIPVPAGLRPFEITGVQ